MTPSWFSGLESDNQPRGWYYLALSIIWKRNVLNVLQNIDITAGQMRVHGIRRNIKFADVCLLSLVKRVLKWPEQTPMSNSKPGISWNCMSPCVWNLHAFDLIANVICISWRLILPKITRGWSNNWCMCNCFHRFFHWSYGFGFAVCPFISVKTQTICCD